VSFERRADAERDDGNGVAVGELDVGDDVYWKSERLARDS